MKNVQSVEGEALSTPPPPTKKRKSRKEIKRGGGKSLWPKRACCLNGHWCEGVALVEGQVLLLLAPLSQGCHGTCLSGAWHWVGGRGKCVQTHPTGGAYHSSRVPAWPHPGVFAIGAEEASWLQPEWQMSCRHCTVDNVVDGSMTWVTALTPFAAEAVSGVAYNLHTTVVTGVGAAEEQSYIGKGQLQYERCCCPCAIPEVRQEGHDVI